MGAATSCQYFTLGEEAIPEPGIHVTANENYKGIYSPSKLAEYAPDLKPPNSYKIAPDYKSPDSHKTVYRPAQESLKKLKKRDDKGDRKFADERWQKAKEEWQEKVTADLEAHSAAKEPDPYSSDERTLALQTIREEEEERKRAGTLMPVIDKTRVVQPKELAPIPEFPELPPQPEELSPEEMLQVVQSQKAIFVDVDVEVEKEVASKVVCSVDAYKQELTTDLEERRDEEPAHREEPSLEQEKEKEADDRKTLLEAFLSKNGFDGVSNKRRRTLQPSIYPLHLAADKGDATLVTLLLEAGADANQKDSSGRTPADIAKKKNRKGSHDEVVGLLIVRNE